MSAAGAANDPADPATDGRTGTAASDPARTATAMAGTPTGNGTASSDDVVRDPVVALQRLADVRATALMAADPVVLASAEPAGSSAYEHDVRTVTRLREQGQRYAELAFTVRSAEVVNVGPTTVVLRAVHGQVGCAAQPVDDLAVVRDGAAEARDVDIAALGEQVRVWARRTGRRVALDVGVVEAADAGLADVVPAGPR